MSETIGLLAGYEFGRTNPQAGPYLLAFWLLLGGFAALVYWRAR